MTISPTRRQKPLEAGPVRQAIHALVTLAGWGLFLWWWWLVMQRVSRDEMTFTAWFIALSLVAIVLSTVLWSFHNMRLFRRKGPRTHLRDAGPDLTHDTVGRPVDLPAVPETCLSAREIVIRIEDGHKVYATTGPSQPTLRTLPGGARGEVA